MTPKLRPQNRPLRHLAWLGAAVLLAGCTTQAWYEGMKRSAAIECNKQPPGAVESCHARVNAKSYDDYAKERAKEQAAQKP